MEEVKYCIIRFRKNTIVQCDQGPIEIQSIDTKSHTINNSSIVSVSKIRNMDGKLLYIPKDTFKKNYPNRDTYVSFLDKIKHSGVYTRAFELYSLYSEKMEILNHQGDLYNILLDGHYNVIINGLTVEALCSNNNMTKPYKNIISNGKYASMNKRDMNQSNNKKQRKYSF
jgi:hypothetical protein